MSFDFLVISLRHVHVALILHVRFSTTFFYYCKTLDYVTDGQISTVLFMAASISINDELNSSFAILYHL